ncbi:MAG: class I tRNA ligase family protein, partial [Promethearchaeota archaeon]
FRFYSIGATQPGRDLNFNVKEYADTYKTINTIWNVYVYANEKFSLAKFNPSEHKLNLNKLDKIDKWLVSRLHSVIKRVIEHSDKYELPWIPGVLRDFIVNDVSRWYIMLNREKLDLYSEDPNKYQVMALLFEILFQFLLMLSPINPMLTEEIYLKMFKQYLKSMGRNETESIHLQDYPVYNDNLIDDRLEEQMKFTRDIIETIRALKDENKIRLRWPNKKIIIEEKEEMPEIKFPELIKQMGNVKELEVVKSIAKKEGLLKAESKYYNLYLDISLDDELLAERVVNDLIRNIQYSRKNNKYKVGEEILLFLGTDADYLKDYLGKFKESISEKVTAKTLEIGNELITKQDKYVYGVLNICSNKECSASLKDNILARFKKKQKVKCPYCDTALSEDKIKTISFSFKKVA